MATPEQQQERHKTEVKSAFANYSNDMKEEYSSLFGPPHANPFYRANQERKAMMMEHAIKHNQQFLNQVLDYCNYIEFKEDFTPNPQTTANNRSKIKTTLKQCYREWCSESLQKQDYMVLVEKCQKYLKKDDFVLVPGCGLGRLVVELLCAGFGVEGNEVTYFMLFASNYLLNCTQKPNEFTIYPFIHSMSYYYNEEDIFRSVTIPDKALIEHVAEDANLAIVAGQFCEVYNEKPEEFDGLVSCFFVDTANNIFHYVDTIHTTLKQGGIWVNFGPLLYHYREMLNEVSIEVSWQTLRHYISERFDFLEEWSAETTYCHDPRSEMSVVYKCIGFVCRRKT